ncbi:MAG: ACT domain-containing protein [Promethearchaeota archaeon]
MVTQLSIFIRNKPGELRKITQLLADNSIDIRALTVAETADYGILRIIVNKPDEAYSVLQSKNILVGKTEILAIEMKDEPGGLNFIANILGDAGVNIEYMYAYSRKDTAILLIQVSADHKAKAVETFDKNNVRIFKPEEIYNK